MGNRVVFRGLAAVGLLAAVAMLSMTVAAQVPGRLVQADSPSGELDGVTPSEAVNAPVPAAMELTDTPVSDLPGTPLAVDATISSTVELNVKHDVFAIALTAGLPYQFLFGSESISNESYTPAEAKHWVYVQLIFPAITQSNPLIQLSDARPPDQFVVGSGEAGSPGSSPGCAWSWFGGVNNEGYRDINRPLLFSPKLPTNAGSIGSTTNVSCYFKPPASGTYYLNIGSAAGQNGGPQTYALTVKQSDEVCVTTELKCF